MGGVIGLLKTELAAPNCFDVIKHEHISKYLGVNGLYLEFGRSAGTAWSLGQQVLSFCEKGSIQEE